jgi:hypothetical protein
MTEDNKKSVVNKLGEQSSSMKYHDM